MIYTAIYTVGNWVYSVLLAWLPNATDLTLPDLSSATERVIEYGKMFNWILPIEEATMIIYYGVLIWFYIFVWKLLKIMFGLLPGFNMNASDTSGSNATGSFHMSSRTRSIKT